MYKPINGYTKEAIKAAILKGNKGSKAVLPKTDYCQYLTVDGNKCAVGCFIPEGHKAQSSLSTVKYLLLEHDDLLMPLDYSAMATLQTVHDQLTPTDANPIPLLFTWIDKNVEG